MSRTLDTFCSVVSGGGRGDAWECRRGCRHYFAAPDWDHPQASETLSGSDKSIGWTAPASGAYSVAAVAHAGRGAATFSIEAVGTEVGRAPLADLSGTDVALEMHCYKASCMYRYGGTPMFDGAGDGFGFELLLLAVEGRAYALSVELSGNTRSAAEVHAKIYYPRNAAGAAAYAEALGGALGEWMHTGPGHQSLPEHFGCTNVDRDCWTRGQFEGAPSTFGIHPGGSFGTSLRATWAAPAAGAALLRNAANCDMLLFADVGAALSSGTDRTLQQDGTEYFSSGQVCHCAADLTVAILAGAHFNHVSEGGPAPGSPVEQAGQKHVGAAVREATI
eukprot:SAG22_NODE_2078_length_3044_cov_1.691681_3_plen_334_part_00